MGFLTTPWVADTITGLLGRGPGPRIPEDIAFAELPATTTQVQIPTRHGVVDATVYAPPGGSGGAPVYVNFHGGGFFIRHPEQDDPICRYLAHHAGVVVVNVDYDVAPKHRFPVPVEEGYDVAAWAADPGREWDGTRIGVGGQSAGGAIAAAVARQARDQHGPTIAVQVLHYPPLDLVTPGEKKHAAGKSIISVPMTRLADTAYAPNLEQKQHTLASPAWGENSADLTGIAPAVVITCEYDRLRDEGARYAAALDRDGALIEHRDLPGVDHGYNLLGAPPELVTNVYRSIAGHLTDRLRQR